MGVKETTENTVQEIERRIAELQKSYVVSQEQYRNSQNAIEGRLDGDALKVIDILDLIDRVPFTAGETSTAELIIKKIEKRLIELLRLWKVQEITLKNNGIEPGKTRVLETRQAMQEISTGLRVEICRKGYQRGDKTIRPVDVITYKQLESV